MRMAGVKNWFTGESLPYPVADTAVATESFMVADRAPVPSLWSPPQWTEDRIAVKPHASPVFHAIQYLLGNQDLDKLKAFRAFAGAQSYPSRTKDSDDVDFSTGSVGLGVAMTGFAAVSHTARAHQHILKNPQKAGLRGVRITPLYTCLDC